MTRLDSRDWRDSRPNLEEKLQRKLHDSWISRGQDFAEGRIGKIRAHAGGSALLTRDRRAGIHMVRDIKRLGPELDGLLLANLECSNQGHIDPDTARTGNIACAHLPVRRRRIPDPANAVQVWIIKKYP